MNKRIKTVAFVGVAAVAAGGLYNYSQSSSDAEVVAYFHDASPLVPGNVVKASGVDVGLVKKIDLQGGLARVTMSIDPSVLPLHKDASAVITTQDLLGERFIKLDRGSANAPVDDGDLSIPVVNTSRGVDLQDVLNAVDTPTSVALASMLTGAGEGLAGKGKQADAALAALAPAMNQAKDLASLLSDQNALLTHLVDNAQPVASALAADNGKTIDQLVNSATQSLGAVADERTSLQNALQQLPQTISDSRASLEQLAGLAAPATSTLASLRPLTDQLSSVSSELHAFSDAADPALASLPPVLNHADDLLAKAAPVVAALRPGGVALANDAAAGSRLTGTALSGKALGDLMEFVKGWSMATSDYDAISHYFKAMVPLSPNALGNDANALEPALPANVAHGLPVPSAPVLPLPSRTQDPVSGLLGGAPSGGASPSATGLSSGQEAGLVQQLLGGL